MADDTPSKVGYKKPPVTTRFKPGQSGNPKGRSPGAKSFRTVLAQELDARVEVTEGGRRKKISKRQAFAKQLVNRSAAGDPRAMPLLLTEIRQAEAAGVAGTTVESAIEPEDQTVMENIIRRIRSATDVAPPSPSDAQPAEGSGRDD